MAGKTPSASPDEYEDSLGDVGGRIIEALSTGLYDNILHVIREYVQNSFDAIRSQFPRDQGAGIIEIIIDTKRNTISVQDNGSGMDRVELVKGVNIGYSRKGSEDVGFRGIGMTAGWAIADKIVVLTKRDDEDNLWQAEIRTKELRERLDKYAVTKEDLTVKELFRKYVTITQQDPPQIPPFAEGHGTLVVLEKVSGSHETLLRQGEIVRYLSQVAPVRFRSRNFPEGALIEKRIRKSVDYYRTIQIKVNGYDVRKPYDFDQQADKPRFELVTARSGKKLAFVWYQIRYKRSNKKEMRALRLRIKGFAVGDANYVQNELVSLSSQNLSHWVRGEIYVLPEFVLPTSDRNRLKHNNARTELIKWTQFFAKKLEKEVRSRSDRSSAINKINLAKEIIDDVAERLGECDEFPSTEAKQMIKSVKFARKALVKEKQKLTKRRDTTTLREHGVEKTIRKSRKLEDRISKRSEKDEEVLNIEGDMVKAYRMIKKTVRSFPFQDYCTRKGEALPELKSDLIVAIGEALGNKG